jgi:Protein of unknown function (DUF3618)
MSDQSTAASSTTEGKTPPSPKPSPEELSAEVLKARAELAATIDELSTRLSPKYVAAEAASATKLAAADASAFLTGAGLPKGSDNRARNAKVLLSVSASVVAVVVISILRRKRS